jgi:glycosyltransferase involved in cell wall biosynthesis
MSSNKESEIKKTIQIITSYSVDISPAVRNRLESIVKSYLRMGFAVELLSSDTELGSPGFRELGAMSDFSHISVNRVGRKYRNFVLRAIFEILSACKTHMVAKRSVCDITIITIPSMFLVIPLILISRKSFVVADIRDLTWEYLPEDSFVGRLVKTAIGWFVDRGLKSAHAYTVTNEAEAEYVKTLSPCTPCFHLGNGISSKRFHDLVRLPVKLHKADTQVAYIGTVGIAQHLMTLVSAAELMPNIKFKIVGSGIEVASLKKYCHRKKMSNVVFYGSVSWEEILKVYAESDLLYANISENYLTAVPSKIFEYVSTGRHIIFGSKGISRKILSKFRGVCIINPDDVDELINAIDSFDKTSYEDFTDDNRSLIEDYFLREKVSDDIAIKVLETFSSQRF